MERKAVQILKDWAIPTAAVLVTATGAWVRLEGMASENDKQIHALMQELRASHTATADGIYDPATHGAIDNHIRHFLESELGKNGYRKLINQFADTTARAK